VGCLAFDLGRQIKEGFGNGKLLLDLIDRDAVVDQGQEPSCLSCLNELLGDLVFTVLEICSRIFFN